MLVDCAQLCPIALGGKEVSHLLWWERAGAALPDRRDAALPPRGDAVMTRLNRAILPVVVFAFALTLTMETGGSGGLRLGLVPVAQAQIVVTSARIGCLDIQKSGNLTAFVAKACNGKYDCSYKAPSEDAYRRMGVRAFTRTFCTQGMEITYRCGSGSAQIVGVPGDAWKHGPAQLHCTPASDASTYRSKNGYSFVNSDKFQTMVGGYNWNDMKELYGKCKVDLDAFGFCEVPDPLLAIYIPVLNESIKSGQCFGFSLSSLRFLNGNKSLNEFPLVSGGKDIWHLKGTELTDGQNVDPKLSHYIHLQHALQTSSQAIHHYLGSALGSHSHNDLRQQVSNALSSGGAVLCMHKGNDGHCIVPYAVKPLPNGGFTIENYNPNYPFDKGESKNNLEQSRITVSTNSTDQLGDGREFSGGLTGIVVFPYSLFKDPSPPLGLGILDVIFGGTAGSGIKTTQITDAAGHHLLNPDGSWNTNPRTRIPNSALLPVFGKAIPGTTLVALHRGGTYTHTIENRGNGKYQLNFVGRDFGVQLHDVPSHAGDKETLTLSAANSRFVFNSTAASKPFNAQVLARHADKSVRTAHIVGTSQRNVGAEMGFDRAREVFTYRHAGAPGKVSIRLVYQLKQTTSELKLAPVDVKHGDTLTFKPNWRSLKTADPGTLHVKEAAGGTRVNKIR